MKQTFSFDEKDIKEALLDYLKASGYNIDNLALNDVRLTYSPGDRNEDGTISAVICCPEPR